MKILEIQLFFSTSILPSIVLKRWNFPDNLNFKGKIVAKFLLRSRFFSIRINMTIKQQSSHGAIQKVCVSMYLCHTLSILLSPLNNSLKITNYGMRSNRILYIYIYIYTTASAYYVTSKEVENRIFRHNCILHTYVCINNHMDKIVNLRYFCSVIIYLFQIHWYALGCAFLVACCNIVTASLENRMEKFSYLKKYIEEFAWVTSLPWLPSFLCLFCRYLRLLPRFYCLLPHFCTCA